MTLQAIAIQTRAGAFDTVAQADRAIRQLLAAGFSKDRLAVICSAERTDPFLTASPDTDATTADAADPIDMNSALGTTLGGLALVATVVASRATGVTAAGLLVGGGTIAAGFSNLIFSKGYELEADDYCDQAIDRGQIVVGFEVHGEDATGQLADAQRILLDAGANQLLISYC